MVDEAPLAHDDGVTLLDGTAAVVVAVLAVLLLLEEKP